MDHAQERTEPEFPAHGDHLAFYHFVRIPDVPSAAARIRRLAEGLLGSVIVAGEGVNGMLAGAPERVDAFLAAAGHDEVLAGVFEAMTSTRTTYERPPFRRLLIKTKAELVPLGVSGPDLPDRADDVASADVDPYEWRELLTRRDVVVLDNRNRFEHGVGRFRGAVDPGVDTFRDFADYVRANAPRWRAEGTTVAMYCTGGIRCEKASPWMQDLGLDVRQLSGGILNYFATLPDADRDFDGECFVFDERVTLDTTLRDAGRSRADIDE